MPPVVCINRPNRSAPRHFTERDLERIAKTMVRQGHPVVKILATILIALGLGALTCRLARAVHDVLGILGIVKQIAAVLAAAGATQALLAALRRLLSVRFPPLVTVVSILIVFILAIQAFAKGAAALVSDLETIEEVSAILDEWCSEIASRIPGI